MFRLKFLLFTAILLFPDLVYSQHRKNESSFLLVDSVARTVKYKKDIYRLTQELTNPYPEQLVKVRAIFIWITDNIRYDYKYYNKGKQPKTPKCKPGVNCEQLLIDWESSYIKRILKKGQGVCDGYSRLFKKMCDIAGIRSEIIAGYTKTRYYEVGNTGSVDHSWNAIWLDSAYYLLDATWAAGYCTEDEVTGKLTGFQKQFDNYYWFTPFKDFTRNHYPQTANGFLSPVIQKRNLLPILIMHQALLVRLNYWHPPQALLTPAKVIQYIFLLTIWETCGTCRLTLMFFIIL